MSCMGYLYSGWLDLIPGGRPASYATKRARGTRNALGEEVIRTLLELQFRSMLEVITSC